MRFWARRHEKRAQLTVEIGHRLQCKGTRSCGCWRANGVERILTMVVT